MSDLIRVDFAALDRAVEDMKKTARAIDERLNSLERDLSPLHDNWFGSAKDAYYAQKAKWDGAIGEMRHLLDQTANAVDEAKLEYQAADGRGVATFEGLGSFRM